MRLGAPGLLSAALFGAALWLVACGSDATGGSADAGGPPTDGSVADANVEMDAGETLDAAVEDARVDADASIDVDAMAPADAGARYASTGTLLGHVGDGLDEVSGIAASRTYPGIFWVHNDSGDTPRFFAINESAETVATIQVSGATSEDWEDIAITDGDGGDVLYLANTGDNQARETGGAAGREFVQLYRVTEPNPALGDATTTSERFDLVYPDRPYDCESVFVDHPTGDVYFVTKESSPAEVFVARAPLSSEARITLEHVGTVTETLATAADESRDGTRIVVRGYATIRVYVRMPGESPAATLMRAERISAPPSAAAEAVAFEPDGYGLYTVPEGAGAPLYYIPWE